VEADMSILHVENSECSFPEIIEIILTVLYFGRILLYNQVSLKKRCKKGP
jgi:hypothetical protein